MRRKHWRGTRIVAFCNWCPDPKHPTHDTPEHPPTINDVPQLPEATMGPDKCRTALVQLLRDGADAIEKHDYLKPDALIDVIAMFAQLARTSGDAQFVALVGAGLAGGLAAIRKAMRK